MEFQNVGQNCSLSSCNQHDFLPFTCTQCSQTYCLQHRDAASHACSKSQQGDARTIICPICAKSLHFDSGSINAEELWNKHYATECRQQNFQYNQPKKPTRICASKGCSEKLTLINASTCKICRKETCLKHRFEDQHECGKNNSPAVPYKYTNQPLQPQRQDQNQWQMQMQAQNQSPNQNQNQSQGQGQKTTGEEIQDKIKNFFGGIGSMFKKKEKPQDIMQYQRPNSVQNPRQNYMQYPMQNTMQYPGQHPMQNNMQYARQYTGESLMQYPLQNNNRSGQVCGACGKGFATNYELTTHLQRDHN